MGHIGDTFSLTVMVFVRHFENEIPQTIKTGVKCPRFLAMLQTITNNFEPFYFNFDFINDLDLTYCLYSFGL